MSEFGLTSEERRCLQMWFRQAINQLETEELSEQLVRRHETEEATTGHRPVLNRRRVRRSPAPHSRELVG
jgi:hypothetical protein